MPRTHTEGKMASCELLYHNENVFGDGWTHIIHSQLSVEVVTL